MFKMCRHFIPGKHPLAKNISALPWKKYVLENYVKTIQNNVKLINPNGPTADEIAKDFDLDNKVCLITGANSGIGLEVTRCLSSRNCNILMACRNTYEACGAAKQVGAKVDRLRYYELNLASLESVKKCAENIIGQQKTIDIVILNAATFGLPWTLTEDGLETTFQVNFLSQYYLLLCIEKVLAPNARVVFTSTESHRNVKMPADKMLAPSIEQLSLPEEQYTSIKAYNVSKLCGILAMHYLRYRWLNTDKCVFCAHPGSFVKTRLCRNWWVFEALYTSMLPFTKTVSQAASTIVYCASSPNLQGLTGLYFKDCKHHDESKLAKDLYLSFRIHDLTCDVLRDRHIDCTNIINIANRDLQQETMEGTLISNY